MILSLGSLLLGTNDIFGTTIQKKKTLNFIIACVPCVLCTVYAGQGGKEHQTQKCCNRQGYQDEGEEIQQRQRGKPTVLFSTLFVIYFVVREYLPTLCSMYI